MLNKNHHLHADDEYRSMPLVDGGYVMVQEYLDSLNRVMVQALQAHGKVFAFRFDLHLPSNAEASSQACSNQIVSRFIESLKAKIRHNRMTARMTCSQVHDTRVRYFWVREVGVQGRVHYHFVVLLNGHAFNWLGNYRPMGDNMANRIWEAWASALGVTVECAMSLVHFPKNPSYILFRNEFPSIQAFFQRASYLCKASTKQYGYGHHAYGASRG